MLFFANDYGEGMHPALLKSLTATNMEQLPGYGADKYCQQAAEKIKQAANCPEGEVFFLVGGTQTNQIIIDSMLHTYEGVIAADTGHINGHEGGAIEYSGHKVCALPQHEGKIKAAALADYLRNFAKDRNKDHMVQPGMVYISYPTEYGTLYTKTELEAIRFTCNAYDLKLFVDGARLGYGLISDASDMDLTDIAELADVFYIGGTKAGAICGEAVVFPKGNAPKHFITAVKQHGGLLAKGRLLGIQFDALFTDNLYFQICRHGVEMADEIKKALCKHGYRLLMDSPTNQIFVVLEDKYLPDFAKKVIFNQWEKLDKEHTVIRLATSWGTSPKSVEELKAVLAEMKMA